MQNQTNTIRYRYLGAILVVFFIMSIAVVGAAQDQQGGACASTISNELVLQVPRFTYQDNAFYASFFVTVSPDGNVSATLGDFGTTARTDCFDSDSGLLVFNDAGVVLHVPSLMLGSNRYWINLLYTPTDDGTIRFKLLKYGNGFDGLSGKGSAFLSITKSTITTLTDTLYEVQETFPGGSTADVAVTLQPNTTYSPTAEEIAMASQLGVRTYDARLDRSEDSNAYYFKLHYFIPNSALGYTSALAAEEGPTAVMSGPAAGQLTKRSDGEESGSDVVVDTMVLKLSLADTKEMAKVFGVKGGGAAAEVVGSVLDVLSSIGVTQEYNAWMKRLDDAAQCAENPAVPYGDPGMKQNILDQIEETRSQLKANTAVRFLGEGASAAAGAAPGIIPIVEAGKSYSDDTLKTVCENLVRDVEKRVQCNTAYQVDENVSGNHIFGNICGSLLKPFTLNHDAGGIIVGIYSCTPANADGGSCTFDGSISGVGTLTGSGTYTVNKAASGNPVSLTLNIATWTYTCPAPQCPMTVPGVAGTVRLNPLAPGSCS